MRRTMWILLCILAPGSLEPVLAQLPSSGRNRFVSGSQFLPQSVTGRGCPCRNQPRLPARAALVPTAAAVSWTETWRVGMHRFLGRIIGNVEEVEVPNAGHSQRRGDARWTRLRSQATFNEEQPSTNRVPTRSRQNRIVASEPGAGRSATSRTGTDRGPIMRWVPAPERQRVPGTVAARR